MRLRHVCTALILGCCTLVGSAQTGSVSAKVAVGTQMSPAGGPLFACFLRRVGTTNAGTLQIADAEYLRNCCNAWVKASRGRGSVLRACASGWMNSMGPWK